MTDSPAQCCAGNSVLGIQLVPIFIDGTVVEDAIKVEPHLTRELSGIVRLVLKKITV